MLISVSTNPLPLFGMTHSLALYISYPAANTLPLVGVFACADSFFTRSGGEAERGGGGGGGGGDMVGCFPCPALAMFVLIRLAMGDVGKDGGDAPIVSGEAKSCDALTRSVQ